MAAATRRILRWFSLGRGGGNRGFGALAEGKNVSSSSQNPHRFRVSIQSSQIRMSCYVFDQEGMEGAVAVAALDMILNEKLAERYRTYWN